MFADDELKDFDFEELDNEIGLGELLKQKDNFFVSLFKKVIFGILVILIGVMVFYASFTIGKVLFLSDNSMPINPQQEEIMEETDVIDEVVATINVIKEEVTAKPVETKTTKPEKTVPIKTEAKPITPVVAPVKVAVVENKAPVVTTVVAKAEPTNTVSYSLIAGTFGQKENAKKVQTNLALHGYESEITTINKGTATLYRVIAGTYTDFEKANALKKALTASGIDSFIDSTTAK